MINYLYKIFFFLLLTTSLGAAENNLVIRGTQNLPIELNLVLDGLQKKPLSLEEFTALKEQTIRIASYATNLTKEEIFFISKASFYKTLLINSKPQHKNYFDGASLKNLADAIQTTNDPFLKWFFQALEKDATIISKMPLYRDYLAARSVGKIEKLELRKIDRKVQLISWWIAKISPDSPDLVLGELNPLLQEILNKVEQSFYLLSTISTSKKVAQLSYFTTEEAAKKQDVATPTPSVNDIIDSVTNPDTAKAPLKSLPSPSNEDWLLGDEPPASAPPAAPVIAPSPMKAIDMTEDL